VFIPIRDDNALKSIDFQYVTLWLIALNIAMYVFQASGVDPTVIASFAVVPSELAQVGVSGGAAPIAGDAWAIPERATLLTYMFFHADIFHLVGNVLFLWVFGDNVEDAMGHVRFLVFYLACGVFAGLFHSWILPTSEMALIGASGAVAGVIAAYLMLHPRVSVWVLAFKFVPIRISAALALGLWILMQLVMVALPQTGPIAWWAHIGGLIAGAVLIVFLRKPGVPLFDRRASVV